MPSQKWVLVGFAVATSFVSVLEAKKREIVDELAALNRQSIEVARQISIKEGQLSNIEELLELEVAETPGAVSERRAGFARFVDVAHEVLSSENGPLHYREIAKRVADRGVRVPGKDPAATLLTAMTRDVRFGRGAKRGLYGLTEWPSFQVAPRRARSQPRRRGGVHRG